MRFDRSSGHDAFFAGLASYYETSIGRVAVPADLFGALEAVVRLRLDRTLGGVRIAALGMGNRTGRGV